MGGAPRKRDVRAEALQTPSALARSLPEGFDGRVHTELATLPPVESLERALFSVISIGEAALTVAILAGLLFVTNLFAQHLVHKTVLALVAWAIFASLLFGHWRFGWRGRTAARYTIAGFVALALAYFGSKFVLETLLGRHWG